MFNYSKHNKLFSTELNKNNNNEDTFDLVSLIYNEVVYGENWKRYEKSIVDNIISFLSFHQINKIKNILDVGCGTGITSIELAKRGKNVIGIDVSKKMCDIVKRKTKSIKNYKVINDDWNELKNYNFEKKFDLILFRGGNFELCKGKKEALNLINIFYDLLDKVGCVYLTIRDWEYLSNYYNSKDFLYVSSKPIIKYKNIYTVFNKYEMKKFSSQMDMFLLKTNILTSKTDAYFITYDFPIYNKLKLLYVLKKSKFNKFIFSKDLKENLLNINHISVFLFK